MQITEQFISEQSNHGKANANQPTYIVIHDTGNTSPTADADNHQAWLNSTPKTGRSAHIYVDDHQAIQIIPFNTPAWHTGKLYVERPQVPACNNFNSIGIEFCVNSQGNLTQTLSNLVDVVAQVMRMFNIPLSRVITHQMSSGKICPMTFVRNPMLYKEFMANLKKATTEDVELTDALNYLKEKGVVNTPSYWLNHIYKIEYLRELFLNMNQVLKEIEGGK